MSDLPIEAVLPDVGGALKKSGHVVLQAPPGAGKTTRVPIYLLENKIVSGRIVMLEPRRVAARAAATQIASLLGETVGTRVGYRMRGDSRVSAKSQIEVVTEGVLTRMIQDDPELSGIGCIIFDEFHERSLQADLGLALSLEIKSALRPDLKLVVMSATLDAEPVASLMGHAPVVTSEGRSYDVETIWLDAPWAKPGGRRRGFEVAAARLTQQATEETDAGVLVFLPGAGEISKVSALLDFGEGINVVPLYGALPFKAQLEALSPPAPGRRKVVLSTSIAETSMTIPDVRAVVDCGLSRRPTFDPGSGMTRLETTKVSKAEATQRRGRAGRVAPGRCYRLWTKGEEGGLAAFPPVEIEDNDLLGLTLELALWGVGDANDMPFLTPPPKAALSEAGALLERFGALDQAGKITEHGGRLAALPLHPRLGQMVLKGRSIGMGRTAPELAALLQIRGQNVDLEEDLRAFRQSSKTAEISATLKRIGVGSDRSDYSVGALVSLAFPDRIAKRRSGDAARYLTAGGKGAVMRKEAALAASDWLAIAEVDGDTREANIRRAARVSEAEVIELHGVETRSVCYWDKANQVVVSQEQVCLSSIVLSSKPGTASDEAVATAVIQGVRSLGLNCLPWTKVAKQLVARVEWARSAGGEFPDMSDPALLRDLADWLSPYLLGVTSRSDISKVDLLSALEARLGYENAQDVRRLAPSKFVAPTGTGVTIDYSGEVPKISIRLQEMMGLKEHPTLGTQKVPLLVELLSPAHRPIQTTADLPGFWATSYKDVRKDMRGRYPKHHWPEDPSVAEPTRRVKSNRK